MAPAGKQIVALALVGAACGAQAFHAPSQFVGQRIVAPRAVAHASGESNRTAQQAIFIVRLLCASLQHCALIYKTSSAVTRNEVCILPSLWRSEAHSML
jgi:hypothetical protein